MIEELATTVLRRIDDVFSIVRALFKNEALLFFVSFWFYFLACVAS